QLLSYLLSSGRHGGALLRPVAHAVLGPPRFRRLLFVSLSRDGGIRIDSRGFRLPRAAHPVFLSRGHGRHPLRAAEPAADAVVSGTCRTPCRNQSPPGTGSGRSAALRTPGRSWPALRWTGP